MNFEIPILKKSTRNISTLEKSVNTHEDTEAIVNKLSFLRDTKNYIDNPDKYKQESVGTYNELISFLEKSGGVYIEDINDIYKKYTNDNPLVVRREDPTNLAELVDGKNLNLKFDPELIDRPEEKYANAALWPHGNPYKTSGLANAFLEGRGAAGPIVTVMGFKSDSGAISIEALESTKLDDDSLDRESVRMVAGEITKEDLEFIVIRIPIKFFDPEKLTESEKKQVNLKQVFRGVSFAQKKEAY